MKNFLFKATNYFRQQITSGDRSLPAPSLCMAGLISGEIEFRPSSISFDRSHEPGGVDTRGTERETKEGKGRVDAIRKIHCTSTAIPNVSPLSDAFNAYSSVADIIQKWNRELNYA